MRKVLDAWAVLAWLEGESARPRIDALLAEAVAGEIHLWMNLVNVGEVYYRLVRRHGVVEAEEFLDDLDGSLPIRTLLPDRRCILDAARIKSRYLLSYADAFAAATAMEKDALLVTGDPELRAVDGLKLEWIGGA